MLCEQGRNQLERLSSLFDFSMAVSEYNSQELNQYGYKNTQVVPIIINFEDYDLQPDRGIINKFSDDWVNIVFVGRIAPNKKQDDIIKAFFYYKKYINPKSRLTLVGSYHGLERYYDELTRLIDSLQLQDVVITGHLPFEHILAYYRTADLFLCMSEHEGFCVPLLEAMKFDLPIVAFKSSAVGETLSNAGLLLLEKDYMYAAELIDLVLKDDKLGYRLKVNREERLQHFSKDHTKLMFRTYIEQIVGII
ncbi:hypothetical protein GCM10020370_16990 [Paenibacillus hodogayensis]